MNKFIRKDKAPLCACGCGSFVIHCWGSSKWNQYIYGHNRKGKHLGEETKNKLSKRNKGKILTTKHRQKISESNKGHIVLETTKKKISEAQKGKKIPTDRRKRISQSLKKYFKSNINAFRGKTHSQLTKGIMSELKKGIALSDKHKKNISNGMPRGKDHPMYGKCGALSPNWRGGIAAEPYCDIWLDEEYKQSIRDRDNNECQNPDCRNNCDHLSLNIHHINYIKKNCHPWNLISLCTSCNFRANTNRKKHTQFYQNIMTKKYGYKYEQL